jgi:precorrin-6Y C5,15-methyltransferase (decarboxylating)
VAPGPGADVLPTGPGLPDSAYRGDGQLTKREVRAVTLAALGPLPGQTLWDVGAGTGTIGIEWMRSQPGCHAVAVEPRPDRASTIAANAAALGVPGIDIVVGAAPAPWPACPGRTPCSSAAGSARREWSTHAWPRSARAGGSSRTR